MSEVVIAVIGAVFGGIVAYFLAIQRAELELTVKIDEATRKDRVDAYKKLWAMTGLLPRYPPEPEVSYAELNMLCKAFRTWYFDVGGIYLSEKTRDVYFEIQNLLMGYAKLDGHMNPFDDNGDYNEASDYEKIRTQLSTLRTQLTEDIGSRRTPGLAQVINEVSQTNL